MSNEDDLKKGARAFGAKIGETVRTVDDAAMPMRMAAHHRLKEIGMRQGITLGMAGSHLGMLIGAGFQYGIAARRWIEPIMKMRAGGLANVIGAFAELEVVDDPSHSAKDKQAYRDRKEFLAVATEIAFAMIIFVEDSVEAGHDMDTAVRGYLETLCDAVGNALVAAG